MGSWRTQVAVVVLISAWLPASAQSLGDAARAERERQSKIQHHAPVLTDEDLGRGKILPSAPRGSDSGAQPAESGAAINEDVPLGDYARALRQRRAGEQASAPDSAATPGIESVPASPVAQTPLPQPGVAAPDQSDMPLGDAARQVRSERDAARATRMRDRTPQAAAAQQTALPSAHEPSTPSPAKSIRVPRGSSLWRLAQQYLGSGRMWRALWKANPQIHDPNRIRAGQMLRYPVLRDQEPGDSSGSAGLSQLRNAAVSSADSVAAVPTRLGIRSDGRLRKSLLSRELSR